MSLTYLGVDCRESLCASGQQESRAISRKVLGRRYRRTFHTRMGRAPRTRSMGRGAVKEPSATPGEIMTPAQVAGYLQVHKLTVYRYVRDRQLPAVRLGRALRILKADVDEFLRLHRIASTSSRPIPNDVGRRRADRRGAETTGRGARASHDEPFARSLVESRPRHEDPLTWNLWDWVARGLH
jgi:putative molybdopterin biosynthesis protein